MFVKINETINDSWTYFEFAMFTDFPGSSIFHQLF